MIKFIELTRGQYAIVDAEDFEHLNKSNWIYTHGYARNNNGLYLHRKIMNAKKGDEIDHIDRDKLDCRKENLRFVSRSLNTFNHPIRKNNTSGHKGVWWNKNRKTWIAEIMVSYKKINLGHSKNKEDAIALRVKAEEKYFGS